MMNSAPISLVTSVVSYLPDQDAYRVAGVSRSFRQASYAGRVWIERLARLQWQPRFFLPPAGAGELLETALRAYDHFLPIGDIPPYYAYRQTYLANAHPDLADRYPHVVPGVATLRTRVRAATWVRLHPWSGRFTSLLIVGATLYTTQLLARVTVAVQPAFLNQFGSEGSLFLLHLTAWGCASIRIMFYLAIHHRVDIGEIIHQRLPSIAGRVVECVTFGQLVVQRALQTVTCKVRVMIRRYWH